jgi:hypothetical protein
VDEAPQAPFSGGPYFFVALPVLLVEVAPLNVSSLVAEWELLLDPLRALRAAAIALFDRVAWTSRGNFTVPGFDTLTWLRRASLDDDLADIFATATATIEWPTGRRDPILGLVSTDSTDDGVSRLTDEALPVLLGLAVISLGTRRLVMRASG